MREKERKKKEREMGRKRKVRKARINTIKGRGIPVETLFSLTLLKSTRVPLKP